MRRLGAPEGEEGGLADSLPSWEPFPEVHDALAEARERGWKLAILSNSDPDLIAASKELIGVPFDETVVASEIHSYKPAVMHFLEFQARTLVDRNRHVHVAASIYHDVVPANTLADSEHLDQPARRASGGEPGAGAPGSHRASGHARRAQARLIRAELVGGRCNRQASAPV